MKKPAVLLCAVLLLWCPAFEAAGQQLGQQAPPLKIGKWIKGQPVQAFESEQIYVVEFWGTWCPPCRNTIPHLTKLQAKFGDSVIIVGISSEQPPVVEEFVRSQGQAMAYRVAVDQGVDTANSYMKAFKVGGIPHAFIVRRGKIVWHGHPKGDLEQELERLTGWVAPAGSRPADMTQAASGASAGKGLSGPPGAAAATPTSVLAGGRLDRDTTIKDGSYTVAGFIHVPYGVTLTIEAGTTLSFRQHMGLYVEGTLAARGNPSLPIVMTGERKIRGFWFGVNFHNSDNYDNVLEHVTIEYGGSDRPMFGAAANLALTTNTGVGSRVTVNHCTIQESGGFGIFCTIQGVMPSFRNNWITRNAEGPCWADAQALQYLDASSSYRGNDEDRVLTGGHVYTTQRWQALDVPYVVTGNADVPTGLDVIPGAILTLDPGARLVFQQNRSMGIGGAMKAQGTRQKPIVFTGEVRQSGSWGALGYYNTNHVDNLLEHVVIEYAGGGEAWGSLVLFSNNERQPVRVRVSNSAIRHGAKYGIVVSDWGSIALSNVTYAGNAQGDYWGPPPQ